MLFIFCFFFFFSSRRRHTRSDRDWSSDVCSSDLIAVENEPRVVPGDGDQLLMGRQIGEAEFRQTALPRAQHLAGAAELQILLGNAETVVGLAQDGEALLRRLAQGLG